MELVVAPLYLLWLHRDFCGSIEPPAALWSLLCSSIEPDVRLYGACHAAS
jgi:hypothetical protein